jgi:hypothetical protein
MKSFSDIKDFLSALKCPKCGVQAQWEIKDIAGGWIIRFSCLDCNMTHLFGFPGVPDDWEMSTESLANHMWCSVLAALCNDKMVPC